MQSINEREQDLKLFYQYLNELEEGLGGKMDWPRQGVYFFLTQTKVYAVIELCEWELMD